MSNGFKVEADRPGGFESELLVFTIWEHSKLKFEWRYSGPNSARDLDSSLEKSVYIQDIFGRGELSVEQLNQLLSQEPERKKDGVARGNREYINGLESCVPSIFFVSAERKLASDSLQDIDDDAEVDKVGRYRVVRQKHDLVKDSRQAALKLALSKASRWVRDRALRSATQGSMNVHSVYEQILEQLSIDYGPKLDGVDSHTLDTMMENLEAIEDRSSRYSKYGLTNEINMSAFRNAISEDRGEGREISAKLIDPYIQSVLGRLDALDDVYLSLDRFVTIINGFLNRKNIEFSMKRGFRIIDEGRNYLDSDFLSSGEQQLLLMFCYALTAQEQSSVFIIDEPEISLNVKWQKSYTCTC